MVRETFQILELTCRSPVMCTLSPSMAMQISRVTDMTDESKIPTCFVTLKLLNMIFVTIILF